jgi:hypothetical protein
VVDHELQQILAAQLRLREETLRILGTQNPLDGIRNERPSTHESNSGLLSQFLASLPVATVRGLLLALLLLLLFQRQSSGGTRSS